MSTPLLAGAPPSVPPPATGDVVEPLTDALRHVRDLTTPPRGRPLDVQYWACWVALVLTVALSATLVVLG